jgi:hypothetical protein
MEWPVSFPVPDLYSCFDELALTPGPGSSKNGRNIGTGQEGAVRKDNAAIRNMLIIAGTIAVLVIAIIVFVNLIG